MGLIAILRSFTRVLRSGAKLSDVKLDSGGGANLTAENFADAGDDSHPLPGDYVAAVSIPRDGGQAAVGYADTINDPKAGPGEKRIYGRSPDTGLVVNEVWLKADSSVIISNALGSIELKPDGSVDINGAIISAAGEITNASGVVLGTHTHAQGNDSDGDSQAETDAPT